MKFSPVAMVVLAGTTGAMGRPEPRGWWSEGFGPAGVNDPITASTTWDPDGAGPADPLLIIAGQFELVGRLQASHIAAWNPRTGEWSTLGAGLNGSGTIYDFGVLPTGELVVAGSFSQAGSVPARNIAAWNGSTWRSLGSGTTSPAYDIEVLPSGEIFAGHQSGLQRWDGAAWSNFGAGIPGVTAVTVLADDTVAIGTGAGIFRWENGAWVQWGAAPVNTQFRGVYSFLKMPDGSVVAGGGFIDLGGVAMNGIARWDGNTWVPMGSDFQLNSGYVAKLSLAANGDVLACGTFSGPAQDPTRGGAVRWNGASWTRIVPEQFQSYSEISTLTALPDGRVVIAGAALTVAGEHRINGVAITEGSRWAPLVSGDRLEAASLVTTIISGADGAPLIGGSFASLDGVEMDAIARLGADGFEPFGSGWAASTSAMTILPGGEVVATGRPLPTGELQVRRSSGAEWTEVLPRFSDGNPSGIHPAPGGGLYITGTFWSAGYFCAAAWNGAGWTSLGAFSERFVPFVKSSAIAANGDLLVGGSFSSAGGQSARNIARWNGQSWSAMGSGFNDMVYAIAVSPTGEIYAGGSFDRSGASNVRRIARWTGSAWAEVGTDGANNTVRALGFDRRGRLLAGGTFTTIGGTQAVGLARWNGSRWDAFGSGVEGTILAIGVEPNGDLVVGGSISIAGGHVSHVIARWHECVADFNGDAFVDFFDYADFVVAFETGDLRADTDDNGFIDFFDYSDFVEAFEAGC